MSGSVCGSWFSSKTRLFLSVLITAVFSMMVFVGCDDGNPSGKGPGGGDSNLVGYWLDNIESSDNFKAIIHFEASGKFSLVEFQKVNDFWIEGGYEIPIWRTNGNRIILTHPVYGDEEIKYTLSGNTLTVTFYDDDYEYTSILTRTDFSSFKSSLGTIRATDPDLYLAPGVCDLAWELSTDRSKEIDFDGGWFYDGEYYTSDWPWSNFNNRMWYTIGSRVFLIGVKENCVGDNWDNCTYTMGESTELDYKVTVTGSTRTLTLRLVEEGGSLGEPAVWLPTDLCDDRYSQTLSKKSKEKSKSPFKALNRSVVK